MENQPHNQFDDHDHSGRSTRRLDPQFFLPLPFFSTVPTASNAPYSFLYSDGASTHRIYFRRDNEGTAELYYVALTKV